jgi:hypothetical protein
MDKQSEIKILQSLKGDTYFEQFFSSKDIDRMCENIRNDFAIDFGCGFNVKAELLQRVLDEAIRNHKEFNELTAHRLIDIFVGDTALIDSVLIDLTSRLSIIKYKRERGYTLSGEEIDFLIKEASK